METNQLVERIKFLNKKYREGFPEVSDYEYDELLDQLKAVDPSNELLKKAIIEEPAQGSRKRKLPYRMASMDKLKSIDEIIGWMKSKNISNFETLVLEPKYNGISILADFNNSNAYTRGDGEFGQESWNHFMRTSHRNFMIKKIVVNGEAIISRKNWEEHFKGRISPSGNPYKINHSTVSGLFNADEPAPALSFVDFIPYGIKEGSFLRSDRVFQIENLNRVFGSNHKYSAVIIDDITPELLGKLYNEWSKEYPIDGIIIRVNDYETSQKLGDELNGNPAYAKAIKLNEWVAETLTTVTGYDLTISKQGKLKGTVKVESIEIDGTDVTQASFYNAKFLFDFLPIKGTQVTLKKSGDIIPKIISVNGVKIPLKSDYKSEKEFIKASMKAQEKIIDSLPEYDVEKFYDEIIFCPSCGEPMEWDLNSVELICKNTQCPEMLISKIEHFFLTVGVEEFARSSIKTLFNAGYKTIEQILSISKDNFSQIEGFGSQSAETVLNQFKMLMREGIPFARYLAALDIFEGKIGEKTVQLIFDNIDTQDTLNSPNIKNVLCKIKGVSEITANIFIDGMDKSQDFNSLFKWVKITYLSTPKKVTVGEKYSGMKVCFSGIRDKELEKEIILNGGEVVSGVSKNTTHLIVADKNQKTSKLIKAEQLDVKVNTINEFKIIQ